MIANVSRTSSGVLSAALFALMIAGCAAGPPSPPQQYVEWPSQLWDFLWNAQTAEDDARYAFTCLEPLLSGSRSQETSDLSAKVGVVDVAIRSFTYEFDARAYGANYDYTYSMDAIAHHVDALVQFVQRLAARPDVVNPSNMGTWFASALAHAKSKQALADAAEHVARLKKLQARLMPPRPKAITTHVPL
jgi:hypothetical protein